MLEDRYIIDAETGCHVWQGSLNNNGYGKLTVEGRTVYSHRLAYELEHGPIPVGLTIDHLCRNRRCCNPAHLEAVSHKENVARRPAPHRTHCARGHVVEGKGRCKLCRNPNRKPVRPYTRDDERARIVAWARDGVPIEEIARRVDRHKVTIKRILKAHSVRAAFPARATEPPNHRRAP